MLKTWVGNASSQTQKKWETIKESQGKCKGGTKNKQRTMVLNLALIRRSDWEELVATELHEYVQEKSNTTEGKWLYRGELEKKVGIRQATLFIDSGKWEKGEDSGGDSLSQSSKK